MKPGGKLPRTAANDAAGMSRRKAFRRMLGETVVFFEQARGRQYCSLKDIEKLEEAQLFKLIPKKSDECRIDVRDNRLMASLPKTGEIDLFELTAENRLLFNAMNGTRTLAEVAQNLAAAGGLDEGSSRARARELFLDLLGKGVMTIANPLEE